MSQIKVNEIYDASGGSAAKLYGPSMRYGGTAFVNRIINGDMRIDQRNAGAAVANVNGYLLDRFSAGYYGSATGRFTGQQSTTAPAGFVNSMALTVTTAQASLASGDGFAIRQAIEGNNTADLTFGSASAASVTVSFWVRSSQTGTFGVIITNGTGNRAYGALATINSANTFEYKTVTIAGDTAGTWLTNTGVGFNLFFGLGGGASRIISAGWSTGLAGSTPCAVTGQTLNICATNGATFYITGVQLEAGTVATPFECRDYGRELMMCQRYFFKTYNQGTAVGAAGATSGPVGRYIDGTQSYASLDCRFPVSMRAVPSVTTYAPNNGQSGVIQTDGPAYRSAVVQQPGEQGAWAFVNNISLGASVSTIAHFVATAEL